MASRVAPRSAGHRERAADVRPRAQQPPLGDGGSRSRCPSERERTGEPSRRERRLRAARLDV